MQTLEVVAEIFSLRGREDTLFRSVIEMKTVSTGNQLPIRKKNYRRLNLGL